MTRKIFLSLTYVLLIFLVLVSLTTLTVKNIINLTPSIAFSILLILFINISFFINNISQEYK